MKTKEKKLSPMMEIYKKTKQNYKDCILFYRLGDFYEMFDEDAIIASKELGLTLTGKNCGLEERAPMCGVPYHAYEQYAAKLVSLGYKIAICEQITEPQKGKLVDREVVRIITAGTLMDSSMLTSTLNNYIMSIYKSKDTISYACCDISTGEFMTGYSKEFEFNYINDEIMRLTPSEIICNDAFFKSIDELTISKHSDCPNIQQYYEWSFNLDSAKRSVLRQYNITTFKGYDFDIDECVIAIGALLDYIKETQKRDIKHLKMPSLVKNNSYMYIDSNTRRNLEIESTMRDNKKSGSLLGVLDKTVTSGGARRLRQVVNSPMQDKTLIEKRLDMVEFLTKSDSFRVGLNNELKNIQDIERIVGKISFGNINPRETLSLMDSLNKIPKLKQIILSTKDSNFIKLANSLMELPELVNTIFTTIRSDKDDGLGELNYQIKEGGYIKSKVNGELDHYRSMKFSAVDYLNEFQEKQRNLTGIKTLKVAYNKVFGYYIEVPKQYANMVPLNYERKQTISNNDRYTTDELKQLEHEILTSSESSIKLEIEIFENLRSYMMQFTKPLQSIALIISNLDVILSFASVAVEMNYTRPIITTDGKITIKDGRHPVLEKMLDDEFIPNDSHFDDGDIMLLTGPNMAGKSTYMRQVALITYMAHLGCFVPAKEASISLTDRIFTRIGASDDLLASQSTFMVEMVEVSNILRFATKNSLIILDEVGRGTSTYDGLSIAESVIEYLDSKIKAKTLFATHYLELTNLEGKLDSVKNYCISIDEHNGKLVFLRKIKRGSATKSYGIEVASLAGLPNEVIERAKQHLKDLEG